MTHPQYEGLLDTPKRVNQRSRHFHATLAATWGFIVVFSDVKLWVYRASW